jgi:outer membrane protein assembly factor BamB
MSLKMRRIAVVFLGVGALAALAIVQPSSFTGQGPARGGDRPGLGSSQPELPTEFTYDLTLPIDRKLRGKMEAAQDKVNSGEWGDACHLLQGLLEAPQDSFAPVVRTNKDGKQYISYVSVKSEANRMIGDLPEEGKKFYRANHNPTAQRLLDDGLKQDDWEQVARVAVNYLNTDAGGEAASLLATHWLDRGDFHAAALYFEKLIQRNTLAKLSELTLAKAALAFHALKDNSEENRNTYESILRVLAAKCPDGVNIGGQKIPMDTFRSEIGQYVYANQQIRKGETPYIRGSESRNALGKGSTPLLEAAWSRPVVRQKALKDILDEKQKQFLAKQPVLPGMFPVTVTVRTEKDTIPMIVFRSYYGVEAVDMRTGRRRWDADSRFGLDRALTDPNGSHWNEFQKWIGWLSGPGRQNQLWENSVIGSIASDGKYVYVVDDLYIMPAQNMFNPNVNPWGQPVGPPISDPALAAAIQYNQLSAYDLRSGKIKWFLGGPSTEKGAQKKDNTPNDLLGAFFLGPPLPMAGKLFLMIEKDQELKLLCLNPAIDPAQGNPIVWSQNLAETRTRMTEQPHRRVQAAHLAYGQGIMVCPTNAGAVLGVDLLSHSLVWASAYRTAPNQQPDDTVPQPGFGKRFPQPPVSQPLNKTEWKSTPPVIVDGKVVYAPQDGDNLICLNLKDGSPAWEPIKRTEDDQYLAGVFGGKILVVTKKQVIAYNLADGKRAWAVDTGMPSGQGVASDNLYYLPLRSTSLNAKEPEPEICVIDIEKGAIESHVKSRTKDVPGNLVFFEGQMISQSTSEISAYWQLQFKIDEADRALAQNPNDPKGRTDRAQLRLYRGNRDGAIEDLHVALQNSPPEPIRRKARKSLHECFTELLMGDFNANEKWLDEFKAVSLVDDKEPADDDGWFKLTRTSVDNLRGLGVPEPVLGKLGSMLDKEFKTRKTLLDEVVKGLDEDEAKQWKDRIGEQADREQRVAEQRHRLGVYWYIVAQGRDRQGKLKDAFDAYLSYARNSPQGSLLSSLDEPSVESPPDVWARGRISAMLTKATPEQRRPLEETIAARWNEIKGGNDLKQVEEFVSMFGTQFKVAREARLQLAERLMETEGTDHLTEAESHLIRLRDQKDDRQAAALAVESLARLMTKKNLLEEGAYYYTVLGKEYGDVIIRDGKTGADLFNELATDKRYWGLIDQSGQLFNGVKLHGSKENGNFGMNGFFTFEVEGDDSPFFRKNKVQIDLLNGNRFRIVDRFTGEEKWGMQINNRPYQFNLVVQMSSNNAQLQSRFPAVTVGHLVILQMCHMVYCFDPIQKKMLWEKNLLGSAQPDPNFVSQQPGVFPDPRDGSLIVVYGDGWSQRLGHTGPINSTCVCVAGKDGLTALNPLTGKEMWIRRDIKSEAKLDASVFGDSEYILTVLVNTDNQSAKEGRAFRAADGVSVTCPDFSTAYQNRVRLCGRNILVKEADGSGVTLRLYDPIQGKDLWQRKFPLNSIVLHTEEANLTGIVDPDGNAVVFDIRKPEEAVFKAVLKKEHLGTAGTSTVQFVQDGTMAFLLINEANNPAFNPWGGPLSNLVWTAGLRALPVNGQVYAFDKKTKKIKWYSEVRQMMLLAESSRDLPVLLFSGRYSQPLNPVGGRNPQNLMAVRAIDKRTGKLVYDEFDTVNGPQFHTLNVKPREGVIEFIAPNLKIVLKPAAEGATSSGGGLTPSSSNDTAVAVPEKIELRKK